MKRSGRARPNAINFFSGHEARFPRGRPDGAHVHTDDTGRQLSMSSMERPCPDVAADLQTWADGDAVCNDGSRRTAPTSYQTLL